jgi:FkbM family methyltransferase
VTETFAGCYHLPPQPPPGDSVILDLGANIGLTACHFAHLYPGCTTIAVEMDPANASLAEVNVGPWSDRVRVINAAVWTESGTIAYGGEPGNEYGYAIAPDGGKTVAAVTLDQLTEGLNVGYLKMDIEGAEEQVLSPGRWVDRVRCMKVEVHAPFTRERCTAVLQALGFTASADERHWSAVVAHRP